jgi:hypothetical protein
MRPYEYITVMMQFMPDSVVTYTTYLMPNGTGTRLILCAAPPTAPSGEALPEQEGPEHLSGYTEMMQGAFGAMLLLADGVAAAAV